MSDVEVKVMGDLAEALSKLADKPEAQRRALAWLCERFDFVPGRVSKSVEHRENEGAKTVSTGSPSSAPSMESNEIPGIAALSPDGVFVLTLRDVKARSQRDAAKRLIHVSIYAYTRLMKRQEMPSIELTEILKNWRVYDGNTRALIASSKGLVRTKEGGFSLDTHSKHDAESFIDDILNSEVKGSWNPGKSRK